MSGERPGPARRPVTGPGAVPVLRPAAAAGAVRIRPARVADAAAITRLDGLSASTLRALPRDLERAVPADAEVVVLVAVDGPDHLGAAIGQVLLDEGHVIDLAVAPTARGQGIGRRLLEELLAGLRARGAVAHTLEVRPGNRAALGLYRASGFVVEGRRPRYYPDGEDALLLWRRDEERRG
ncbi:MAG: GNAT family N-acetyltransferase [Nitriliruptoraceae bacterium]